MNVQYGYPQTELSDRNVHRHDSVHSTLPGPSRPTQWPQKSNWHLLQPNTRCSECHRNGLDCISDIGSPACRNCHYYARPCSYEAASNSAVTPSMINSSQYDSTSSTSSASPNPASLPTCRCNAVYTTQADQPSQGDILRRWAARVFNIDLSLDIGEARLDGDLPFPLRQARLRLVADPTYQSDTDGHVAVEGEPQVSSFAAVESLLNILRAVPVWRYGTMDVGAVMETFTLKWDSSELERLFSERCSACFGGRNRR